MAGPKLDIIKDMGSGRPFVLLVERGVKYPFITEAFQGLASKTRAILLEIDPINDQNWGEITNALESVLGTLKIRNCSFISFGATCAVVQALSLREPKLVRTLVFVNGSTRAHPSSFSKLIDKIERFLPLGLPLRLESNGFDAKPFLQRIRAPVLVVTTNTASHYEISEAEVLELGLPTAWRVSCDNTDATEFAALVTSFQEVPAKCPGRAT